ncbi:glycosyltransferase [Belliella sp. DSM 107340]|uniref:Glycosyltransferase n=1 Tax=Belliella calami TaxID=2923436 RepID=A0ABS9UIR9_9BACT|nr:glycosyltransferase [Belliella calami]MCH7396513.1 glycosyltransferase [Belliella calami]
MPKTTEFYKFCVIIPCYNQAHFLSDSLNSVINQDYRNLEILVINDGSTDNFDLVMSSFIKKDNRIKIYSQPNQGLSATRNTGLKYANGDFIVFLDADDWLEIDFFKNYSKVINQFPDFELYRCGYSYWSLDRGKRYHTHLPSNDGLLYPNVVKENIGACHSILIKKSIADQLGGFDISLKSCEDWDYWVRAGKLGAKIKSIPIDLVGYRYITDSMSRNAKVMYTSLSKVIQRSVKKDFRISSESMFNQDLNWDTSQLIKNQFIKCLGVLLYQGNVEDALKWYEEEHGKWEWEFEVKEFAIMNSQLSFKYFLDSENIQYLFVKVLPSFECFFKNIGYSCNDVVKLIQIVFEPQFKKKNHLKFGKYLGKVLNTFSIYNV